jgi:peptidyl-prolyl cis-trans isomerase D
LLTLPSGADPAAEQAVKTEIDAVRKRLEAGEPFDRVAKEVSKDPGSASQGGALGEIERGMMDPAFEQAAFSLTAGELSQPVKTRFGYHLIQVESIVPPSVKPFESVRDQLRGEVAKQRAESVFYDMSERLANLVYESTDSLEPAAKELGLEVRHSDWIARQGGEGLLGNPKVTAAAFSEEVMTQGRNSELIEPEKDALQAVVVRVADHRVASVRPLSEVREEIVAEIRKERARKAAAGAATAGADKLKAGADWASVAGTDKVEDAGLVGRNDPTLPAPVRTEAFILPIPAKDKASVGTAGFDDGDAAIVRVTQVEDGKPAGDKDAAADETGMLGQLMGRQVYDALMRDMERRAKIERKPAVATPEG